ncbi:hypothetical protein HHL28_07005 [Aerophototrophica crusticola]|uniref:Endonuclease/exonuclease/phosphatase domain-containing protein n=1 Tax=Aerophototrophica crusticola TaxID=1709002 RepID=A0A858R6G7_9PROT|nr:hypothetical protein HHL28_07005 [Rhodospirillaceae bacterium B3]
MSPARIHPGRRLGRALLLAAALALVILSLAGWVPGFPTFEHLRIPYLWAGSALLALSIPLRAWAAAGITVMTLALNAWLVLPTLPLGNTVAAGSADVTLVHINIWKDNATPELVRDLLRREQPDVAVLLEVHDPRADQWLLELERLFPFKVTCGRVACGVVLLSRWPLEKIETTGLDEKPYPGYVAARVDRPSGAFTLVGTHLSQPFFPERQAAEAEWLARRVRELPGPVVLTGDYNATPWSNLVTRLQEQSGLRRLARSWTTWPTWGLPIGIPIDLGFGSDGVTGLRAEVLGDVGSDHRPVRFTLTLPPGPAVDAGEGGTAPRLVTQP